MKEEKSNDNDEVENFTLLKQHQPRYLNIWYSRQNGEKKKISTLRVGEWNEFNFYDLCMNVFVSLCRKQEQMLEAMNEKKQFFFLGKFSSLFHVSKSKLFKRNLRKENIMIIFSESLCLLASFKKKRCKSSKAFLSSFLALKPFFSFSFLSFCWFFKPLHIFFSFSFFFFFCFRYVPDKKNI